MKYGGTYTPDSKITNAYILDGDLIIEGYSEIGPNEANQAFISVQVARQGGSLSIVDLIYTAVEVGYGLVWYDLEPQADVV